MFHFSADRLAGLDNMILKITSPQKVPTLIPNHSLHYDPCIPVKKLPARAPFANRTASNNLAPRPPHSTTPMLLHLPDAAREVKLLSPVDLPFPRASSPDIPSFRPLPPLPSASTLQLPSFLHFSDRSVSALADPPAPPTPSLPASAFCVSPSPVVSSRPVARKAKNSKVFEGPHWIPAFHHPNSPYVPWSSPVKRRILLPPSPLSPSLVCPSPCIRSGAVAPEPWASSTFSQSYPKSRKEKLSSSWKSIKNSIKQGVRTVISHLEKSGKSLRVPCTGQDVLRTYDDTDTATVQPNLTSDAMRSNTHCGGPPDSLASFASSDSRTLAGWLAERRAHASCVINVTPREMTVEEYELMGSWLDLRPCGGGWVCGIQDCDMHTAGGSPCVTGEHSDALRTAMPFDSADLLSSKHRSPEAPPSPFPAGPFDASPRYCSLPCLFCQSFDIYSAQEAMPATLDNAAERCPTPRCRELSMPGGWTF